MSSQIDLLAIISPKPGKADRVVELLQEVSEYVKNNEPDTLKYEIIREVNKKSGAEQVIMIETYKSKAAMGAHASSKDFKAFQKKMAQEDLVGAPMQLKFVKSVGGFPSRL
ncbi:hypothetical protein D0Z07_5264 [Hyphodiscus hymeniophilus]|uniref:ABM domain-containing protein n=1 Tax=Hyphodiscus hymeniophilus TaxID=353542 RepID=A0A9P7AWT7_9HELO|nr:hypothetical protein D0Z07_5264 [Hyphodiscus hymeniophilus]